MGLHWRPWSCLHRGRRDVRRHCIGLQAADQALIDARRRRKARSSGTRRRSSIRSSGRSPRPSRRNMGSRPALCAPIPMSWRCASSTRAKPGACRAMSSTVNRPPPHSRNRASSTPMGAGFKAARLPQQYVDPDGLLDRRPRPGARHRAGPCQWYQSRAEGHRTEELERSPRPCRWKNIDGLEFESRRFDRPFVCRPRSARTRRRQGHGLSAPGSPTQNIAGLSSGGPDVVKTGHRRQSYDRPAIGQ